MPILEAAETTEMTWCIRCGKVILPEQTAIQHMPGWACSQQCSTEVDEEELMLHKRSQQTVGALFSEFTGQSLPQ